MLNQYQVTIIELLMKQERLLAELYRVFADSYPNLREFWSQLAQDELKHAEWVQGLLKATEKGGVHFAEGRIRIHSLNTFLGGIETLIEKARGGTGMALINAISHALDLEKSLFEKDIFGHFDPGSEKAQKVLTLLRQQTALHLEKIKAERKKLSTAS